MYYWLQIRIDEPAEAVEPVVLESVAGCPEIIDAIADSAAPEHGFLRAAWYRAAGAETTLVARRGARAIAAFPTLRAGPPALGVRAVAGIYWPFRNVAVSRRASERDLIELLDAARVDGSLGPVWRVGPVYAGDPAAGRLMAAAPSAGWSVLTRSLGTTYLLDIEEERAAGRQWPRKSSLKRLDGYERKLGELGAVTVDYITGADWSAETFDALAEVESRSWVASATDQSGAKFIDPTHRGIWEACAADPVLAEMLSAVIVRLDGRPIAFSLDLKCGALQYGIAGTYDSEFAKLNAGSLANERNMIWAAERGVKRFDWGAGDSGYKRKLGFVAGPQIVDLLFVRSPFVASMLRKRWERAVTEGESDDARKLPLGRREWLLIASIATAAAAGTMAE